MRIESAVVSHEGNIRTNNEDNYFLNGQFREDCSENRRKEKQKSTAGTCIFSVCDGMGGEDYGEVASKCAVKAMKIFHEKKWSGQVLEELLKTVKNDMNRELSGKEGESGTTVTALILENSIAYAVNLGDSRIYLYREKKLLRLSKDHTQAQLMADYGILQEKEARRRRGGHALTRYLGVDSEVCAEDFYCHEPLRIEKQDIFLLCSDGLTDMLADNEIKKCLEENQDARADQIAEILCSLALASGGKDNVTCLIVKIKEAGAKKALWEKAASLFGIGNET